MRGHEAKLERIFAELKAEGLPDDLRPIERQKRVGIKARELGYTDKEIPSRTAIGRWWSKYKAGKTGNTDNATAYGRL